MSDLSTEAIVTIISTIPGLLVSTLSAWFAYKALCRRNPAPRDVETLTLELALVQFNPTSRYSYILIHSSSGYAPNTIFRQHLIHCYPTVNASSVVPSSVASTSTSTTTFSSSSSNGKLPRRIQAARTGRIPSSITEITPSLFRSI